AWRFSFPGYGKDAGRKSSSVSKAVRRSRAAIGIPHWTSHDLRRTAATGMADLGVAPHVIGHVLNHRAVTQGTIADQVYNRYGYDREKRQDLECTARRDHCWDACRNRTSAERLMPRPLYSSARSRAEISPELPAFKFSDADWAQIAAHMGG